ncbi:MAG: antibiotic biosynthesis monooxygenase [Planctomycetes bacterium]|nr:antibiotic biosynthesis monooxygenase [Planctomycetota bacterium]
MIHVNIILTVKQERDVPEIRALLAEQGRLSRKEAGCARFEVYQSKESSRVFILNEWWESHQALEVHRTAKAYTEIYKPKVLPRVDRVAHPSALVE